MIYGLYSIRDAKTGFMPPQLDMNGDSAIRNFEHAVLNPNSLFYTHASDYSLWHVADFDIETGQVIPLVPANHLVDAISLNRKESNNG